MNKNIYANSDEKFVKATVLFSSENKIYYDEACTEEVALEDALNLFKKGLMLVSVDGGFKRPTGITVTESGYEISYGGNGGGSGAEEFVVTFTMNDDETFTADHYNADIVEAYNSGKKIIGKFSTEEGSNCIVYPYAITDSMSIFVGCVSGWFMLTVSEESISLKTPAMLPEVNESDEGKVLKVHDGEWSAIAESTE